MPPNAATVWCGVVWRGVCPMPHARVHTTTLLFKCGLIIPPLTQQRCGVVWSDGVAWCGVLAWRGGVRCGPM